MDYRIQMTEKVATFLKERFLEHWLDDIVEAFLKNGNEFQVLSIVGARVAFTGTNPDYSTSKGCFFVGAIFDRTPYAGEDKTYIYVRSRCAYLVPVDPTSHSKYVFVWGRGDNYSSNSERIFIELK